MTLSSLRQLPLAFAIAITAIALPPLSGTAFSSEAQQMCTGDAMRLCASEIPDIGRITACMIRKRSQVSAGCRAVMDREAAARRNKRAAYDYD